MNLPGAQYEIVPFPKIRVLISEYVRAARKKNNIHLSIEADITMLKQIERIYKETNRDFSLPIYILYCYGQLLRNHPELIAMRRRNKLIMFKRVDVGTIVERDLGNGQKVPMAIVIKDIGSMRFEDILIKIRNAQRDRAEDIEGVRQRRALLRYPYWLIKIIIRYIMADPIRYCKHYGNASFTSAIRSKNERGIIATPIGPSTISLCLNSSFRKVVKEEDGFNEKSFISFTFVVDHDIIDGSDSVKIVEEFCRMVESVYGLEDIHE
jgi:pyruvate/2-oxoglutarate dehydrogenase complex dihydrolipoamide acyltransferase (E2) component